MTWQNCEFICLLLRSGDTALLHVRPARRGRARTRPPPARPVPRPRPRSVQLQVRLQRVPERLLVHHRVRQRRLRRFLPPRQHKRVPQVHGPDDAGLHGASLPSPLPQRGGVQHQPDQEVAVQRTRLLRQRDPGEDHVRGLHQGNQGQLRELNLPWLRL